MSKFNFFWVNWGCILLPLSIEITIVLSSGLWSGLVMTSFGLAFGSEDDDNDKDDDDMDDDVMQ